MYKRQEDREIYQQLLEDGSYSHVLFLENDSGKKGAGACRNIGLKAAKGHWVLFADADDYFVEGFYDKVKRFFNSEYDVVFFMPTSIELDTGKPSDRHMGYKVIIENYLRTQSTESILHLRYRFTAPWSKLIRRDFIIKNGITFDETLASNDMMFSTRIGYHMGNFKVTDEVIYCVTRSRGTLTRNMSEPVFDARLSVFIRTYHFLKERLDKDELKKLHLTGRGFINRAWRHGLGFRKVVSTLLLLRKNRIPIFEWKLLNIIYIMKRMKVQKDYKEKEGKYFIK